MSNTAVAQKEVTPSERFMHKVVAQFGSNVGEIALTKFQQRLVQNCFVALDSALKIAESKRNDEYNKVPTIWANVNMEKLAINVVSSARIGFDPALPNHINLIPYLNKTTKKYDIGFIEGYRGLELKVIKYGLEVPDYTVIEVVYATDKFKPIKKDRNNPIETYEFDIINPFDRGAVVGGFYYHMFTNAPDKNKLVSMSLKDIEKRKPEKASAEFWGGEKDEYKNGKKTGAKVPVEGWYDQMVYKTICRAAYGSITIDSQKIDDDFMVLKQAEMSFAEAEVEQEITQNANGPIIDITPNRPPETAQPKKQQPDPEPDYKERTPKEQKDDLQDAVNAFEQANPAGNNEGAPDWA